MHSAVMVVIIKQSKYIITVLNVVYHFTLVQENLAETQRFICSNILYLVHMMVIYYFKRNVSTSMKAVLL